ncbi:hypothetical protein M427DRAFT_154644 [Gonapodya prolifera JEL478]|uniref:Uncharacterized protein n=1 Tax=Gonapodya prolifera (strain JEL478) TaxID=1344416 RepID=A0A139AHT1_GONPJ|nr:hypothetical protein M427DRAFT_154644 [Gonapodya prolifera JEL478]|eukprot:KXS16320.1 hypothetical protein M427DRAFT_154644 [Gonapodya prolifera JEL478]
MLVMDSRPHVSPGLWAPEVTEGDPRKGRHTPSTVQSHSGSPRRGTKEQGRQRMKEKKPVSFFETVLVCETHGKHEYDRTAVEVAELTREDIQEVLEMRIGFLRQTPPPPPLPLPVSSSPGRRFSTPAFPYPTSSPASYHGSSRLPGPAAPAHQPQPTPARAKTSEPSWSPPTPTSPESSDWTSIAAVLSRPSVTDPLERPAGPVPGRWSPAGRAGMPWERERERERGVGVGSPAYTLDAERNWSSPAAFVTPRPRPPLPPHFPGQAHARSGSGSGTGMGRTWDERRAATGYEAWGVDVGPWTRGGAGGVEVGAGVGQMWDGRGVVGGAPHFNSPLLHRPTPTSTSAQTSTSTTTTSASSLHTSTSATPSPTTTWWTPPSPPSSPETSAMGEVDVSSGGESEVESGSAGPDAMSRMVGGVGDQ